jgi:hypothetical protein
MFLAYKWIYLCWHYSVGIDHTFWFQESMASKSRLVSHTDDAVRTVWNEKIKGFRFILHNSRNNMIFSFLRLRTLFQLQKDWKKPTTVTELPRNWEYYYYWLWSACSHRSIMWQVLWNVVWACGHVSMPFLSRSEPHKNAVENLDSFQNIQ